MEFCTLDPYLFLCIIFAACSYFKFEKNLRKNISYGQMKKFLKQKQTADIFKDGSGTQGFSLF